LGFSQNLAAETRWTDNHVLDRVKWYEGWLSRCVEGMRFMDRVRV
jgi:hypothetical protein